MFLKSGKQQTKQRCNNALRNVSLKPQAKPCKISFLSYVIKENQMTVATVATKFTDAQTAQLVEAYRAAPTADTVAAMAETLGRSVKSVVGKLVSEGVYVSKTAAKAEGVKRETKAEILARVETSLGLDAGTLASLDKGSLDALKALDAATKAE